MKTKTMAGFDAPYVPGWDCHGLPIEIKVDEQLGGKKLEMDPVAVREACREYAEKYIDLQRSQFKRLGVLGALGEAVPDDGVRVRGEDPGDVLRVL